jgi:hypothetical protein
MAAARHAIRSGAAKSKLAAAKAGGMVWPTFNFYWCNYKMEHWKPGDPFPPERRAVPLKSKDIPLEEMWSPDAKSINGAGNSQASEKQGVSDDTRIAPLT